MIECVPNFSEGRDQAVIGAISTVISDAQGVEFLHVDSSVDANRTVMTFAGEKDSVFKAAYESISKAIELIDMRRHHGVHPRLGAVDVCPFVPLGDTRMEVATALAKQVANRIGVELDIPVFLYGNTATHPNRSRLAEIRRGEYEGLPAKLADAAWKPDFGPAVFRPKSGACCVGSRGILIAFNVCLHTDDLTIMREIASHIREKRQGKGQSSLKRGAGSLRACRAIGWYLPTYECAQISMNLEDYTITPPHIAFEEVRIQAKKYGVDVIGSEIIGMVPLQAILMAGRYYGGNGARSEEDLAAIADREMGLSSMLPFEPYERIIEYRLDHVRKQ